MTNIYIAIASWEPRFVLGIEESIKNYHLDKIYIVYSTRSAKRTAVNRAILLDISAKNDVEIVEVEMNFENQIDVYRSTLKAFEDCDDKLDVYFDISTAPRDVSIMMSKYFSKKFGVIKFVYYPAASYGDWLSKEAGTPKLIVGASGLMYPDKSTCVVALCANSIERVEQIYSHFEPSKMVLLWETQRSKFGDQDVLSEEIASISEEVEFRQTDFSEENCRKLMGIIEDLVSRYNVIIMTTGPKIGMAHIMNVMSYFPEVAAAYIPSRFYNDEYSKGFSAATVVPFPLVF